MTYYNDSFDDSLLPTLHSVKDRIRKKKASMIIIDGGVGEGKTTFANHIAKLYQPNFSSRISELVAMGGEEFLKSMDIAVRNGDKVVIYDEAGDFNSRGSLTYFNQTLNRVFETFRQTGIIVILCLPFFADLDASLFKKKIPRILIHCYGRNMKYGKYSVYSLWRTWYLRNKISKSIVPTSCYESVKPNLYGQFKDLPKVESDALADLSIKGKKKIIQHAYLKQKGLVNIDEIVKKTGYAKQTLYVKLKDVKAEKYGNVKYFDGSVIDNLLLEKRV